MTLFKLLFKKSKLKCPRCLGKGFVDWEDIRRLKNQLKWTPAPCAYCNASGKTSQEMLSKVPVAYTYLTIDLLETEMEKIKEGHKETLEKGRLREVFLDNLIKYAEHHYVSYNMSAESITDLYLNTEDENALFSLEREELILYIERIIDLKRSELN